VKLSEEHGWVKRQENILWDIGSKVCVIPNHSCPVANLTDSVVVLKPKESISVWKVLARGKVT